MTKKIHFDRNIQLCVKVIYFSLGLFFTPLSSAKIHIEPYVGFSLISTNSRPLIEKTRKQTTEAINYLSEGRYYGGLTSGMRLGYSSLGLAVGMDITFGYWSSLYKENFTPFRNKEILIPTLPGLFVSYKLPLLLRAYAVLIPQALIQFKSQEGDLKSWCNSSRGAKFGLSYLSLPFMSVNFEYLPLYINGKDCHTWSHTGTAYINFIF